MSNLKPISIYKSLSIELIWLAIAFCIFVANHVSNLYFSIFIGLSFVLFIYLYVVLTKKNRLLFYFDSIGVKYTKHHKIDYWIKYSDVKSINIIKRGKNLYSINNYYNYILLKIILKSNSPKIIELRDSEINLAKFEKAFNLYYSNYTTEEEELNEFLENKYNFIPNRFKNDLIPKLSFIENCEMAIYISFLIGIPIAAILESNFKEKYIFSIILSFLIWGSLIFASFLRMRIKRLLKFYDLQKKYDEYLNECYHFLRYEGQNKYVFNLTLFIVPFISFYIQNEVY